MHTSISTYFFIVSFFISFNSFGVLTCVYDQMEGGLYYSAYCDCDGEASTDNDGFGCGGYSVYLMSYSCGVEAETACPSNLPITPDSLETIENKVKIKFIERAEKKSFGNEM